MDTEVEPNHVVDKAKYWNKLDEAYGFLCLSISRDFIFNITRLKRPKEIWDQISTLFDKKNVLRIYQLENELISLNQRNFETMNYFFTKFKHLVLQLKQCKVEKEDDQLILAILSKHGMDYLVFFSTFHTRNITIPNWKMPSLNAFFQSLINKHDKLVQMGIIISSKHQDMLVGGPKATNVKGNQNNQKTKLDS